MSAEFALEVLQEIALHDGQWSWYQLDRRLVAEKRRPELSVLLMPTIRQLELTGMIRAEINPDRPGIPRYWITTDGESKLAATQS
jgi:hypothetical protein